MHRIEDGGETGVDVDDNQRRDDEPDSYDSDGSNDVSDANTDDATPDSEVSLTSSPPFGHSRPSITFSTSSDVRLAFLSRRSRSFTVTAFYSPSSPAPSPPPSTPPPPRTLCNYFFRSLFHRLPTLSKINQQAQTQRLYHTSTVWKPIRLISRTARCYAHRQCIGAARPGVVVYKTVHKTVPFFRTHPPTPYRKKHSSCIAPLPPVLKVLEDGWYSLKECLNSLCTCYLDTTSPHLTSMIKTVVVFALCILSYAGECDLL